MSTYLDTSKIQNAGRLSIGPSGLRNLNVEIGDSVEIFFDESLGCLLIFALKNKGSASCSTEGVKSKAKEKKQ